MITGRFIVPTAQYIYPIQQLLSSYPPSLVIPVLNQFGQPISQTNIPFPYTLDDLCARCMRVVVAPHHPDGQLYLDEIRANIAQFDPNLNQELMKSLRNMISALVNMFTVRGWYDAEYTSPHRFVGFLDNTFDMLLIKE